MEAPLDCFVVHSVSPEALLPETGKMTIFLLVAIVRKPRNFLSFCYDRRNTILKKINSNLQLW